MLRKRRPDYWRGVSRATRNSVSCREEKKHNMTPYVTKTCWFSLACLGLLWYQEDSQTVGNTWNNEWINTECRLYGLYNLYNFLNEKWSSPVYISARFQSHTYFSLLHFQKPLEEIVAKVTVWGEMALYALRRVTAANQQSCVTDKAVASGTLLHGYAGWCLEH